MADWVHLDVLAIAAHPDDVEITCGGLLIQMVKRGRTVGVLDLTQGEKGTLGDENDRAMDEKHQRSARAALVARGRWAHADAAANAAQERGYQVRAADQAQHASALW